MILFLSYDNTGYGIRLNIYQDLNGFHGIRLTSRTSSAPATSLLKLARTVRVSIIAFTTLNIRKTYHRHTYIGIYTTNGK